jgi:ferrous iron transport protein A
LWSDCSAEFSIANQSHLRHPEAVSQTLDQLPLNQLATITAIDWSCLAPRESRRLRELGFEQGEEVETLHASGWLSRDPIACRIGRMTIAIRKVHAAAISVESKL